MNAWVNLIKMSREKKGWSHRQLAIEVSRHYQRSSRAGGHIISTAHLKHIEYGVACPSPAMLRALIKALDLKPELAVSLAIELKSHLLSTKAREKLDKAALAYAKTVYNEAINETTENTTS